ncbi:MAG: HAMP domain-containing protein [Gammaproteobacteria bacterium]|nr:HAMP domain-containing protein [Gammaproteobacteria bacterium]
MPLFARLSLRSTLALALALMGVSLVLLLYTLTRLNFERGFIAYLDEAQRLQVVDFRDRLAARYGDEQAFARLLWDARLWHEEVRRVFAGVPGPEAQDGPPEGEAPLGLGPPRRGEGRRPGPNGSRIQGPRAQRPPPGAARVPVVLLDAERRIVYGPELPLAELELLPLNDAQGRALGYVGRMPVQRVSSQADALFLEAQERMLLIGLGVSILLALGLAWPLSRVLLAPLRRIADAVSRLMARDFAVRLPEDTPDELGRLAGDVNRLALALAEHSESQRQWLTDLAHELRTPLAVMQAELEALEAGIQEFGPGIQRGLRAQTERLSHLVDDVRELLATDRAALRYEFRPLDLKTLVEDELEGLSTSFARAGLALDFVADAAPPGFRGDARRLAQLVQNLAQNSLRYTDAPGRVRVALMTRGELRLVWEDSAPGVPATALPHLFERFYRADASRARATGGSGLGLAIVANIAAAHEAAIRAEASPLGGLRLVFTFKEALKRSELPPAKDGRPANRSRK